MPRPAILRLAGKGAAVTVEAQRIFNAVGDREGEADALRMQVEPGDGSDLQRSRGVPP